MKLTDESGIELDAEVERIGRDVRVSVRAAQENMFTSSVTVRVVAKVEGAEDLAKAILAVVEEIRALPPDGWRACTAPPAPGTRVRWWRRAGSIDMLGTVLEEPASVEPSERVCVTWDTTHGTGEPLWDQLCTESQS